MTTNQLDSLRPCPFCGSEEIVSGKNLANGYSSVDCLGCTATYRAKSLQIAITDWNTRPIEDALRADLARRDDLIKRLVEDGELWFNDAVNGNGYTENDITLHRTLMKELE